MSWLHKDCANISIEEIKNYERELRRVNGKRYYCEQCTDTRSDTMVADEEKLRILIKDIITDTLNPFKKVFEKELGELKRSVQHMSDCFDEQKTSVEKVMSEIKLLREENTKLKQRVEVLEEKINYQEQKERDNNVVVSGIPKQDHFDSAKKIMEQVFQTMQIQNVNIVDSYRLGKSENAPILVKLDDQDLKVRILKKSRELKGGFNVRGCGLNGSNNSIYINEDLTQQNQILLKKTRDFKRAKGHHSVYTRNGKIYLRLTGLEPAVRIRCENDLLRARSSSINV